LGIGDEVIVTGQVREMHERDPRPVRIVYEKPGKWSPVFAHNPRIAPREAEGDFQELRPRENYLRPYCVEKSPRQWRWRAWRPPRGEFYLAPEEQLFAEEHAGQVVLNPHVKPGASPNKQWGMSRWDVLCMHLTEAGIVPTIIVGDAPNLFRGAKRIPTPTIRHAAALLSKARLVITGEGALHHVAAAVGCRAIVIYGGYISPEVTGYDDQVSLFAGGGLGCGMRVRCSHCEAAMSRIQPAEVAAAAVRLLRG